MTSYGDTSYIFYIFHSIGKLSIYIFFLQIVLVLTEARYASVPNGANSIYSQQLEL